jgi:hypothetical protein
VNEPFGFVRILHSSLCCPRRWNGTRTRSSARGVVSVSCQLSVWGLAPSSMLKGCQRRSDEALSEPGLIGWPCLSSQPAEIIRTSRSRCVAILAGERGARGPVRLENHSRPRTAPAEHRTPNAERCLPSLRRVRLLQLNAQPGIKG